MRERLEEFKSIAGSKLGNQPYSLAVYSAIYLCRIGTWVNRNIADPCIKPFLDVDAPTLLCRLHCMSDSFSIDATVD